MRKVLLIMSIMALLTGCTKAVKTDYKLVSYTYGENCSNYLNSYSYIINKDDEGWHFVYSRPASKYGDLSCDLDEGVIAKLEQICKESQIGKWNGFNKSNRHVLDGDGFSLYASFTDATVSASGYQSYPNGYSEHVKAVEELLGPYAAKLNEEARIAYLSEPFDAPVTSMLVAFNTKDYPKDHEISYHFYYDDDGSLKFYGNAALKTDDFMPAGEYHFDSAVSEDLIDLDGLKEAFLNSGIREQDGLNPVGDDEWYQIDFEFEDGKQIETMGSKAFVNYEEFRSFALLQFANVLNTAE